MRKSAHADGIHRHPAHLSPCADARLRGARRRDDLEVVDEFEFSAYVRIVERRQAHNAAIDMQVR